MRRVCRPRRGGGDFEVCFDEEGLAEKFEECKDTHKNYANTGALQETFRAQILSYKTHFCTESWGVMRGGDCFVRIGIGPAQGTTIRTVRGIREFRVGDNIICSQEAFDANIGANRLMEMQGRKDVIVGSVRLVGTAVSAAGSIVGVADQGAAATTMAITAAVGELASEGIGLWVGTMILGMEKPGFPGMCFAVRGEQVKPIFREDPEVFYQLRFSSDWEERGRSVGAMGR
jgi:hypothetical protein